MNNRYDPASIEPKWQQYWEENDTFRTPGPGDADFDSDKPKYYVLDMFPYPSGAGLHVGHPEGYTATDILARWRRMSGFTPWDGTLSVCPPSSMPWPPELILR